MTFKEIRPLTEINRSVIISSAGETEAGSAGEQPARDSRSGCDEYSSWGVNKLPALFDHASKMNIRHCPNALKKLNLVVDNKPTNTCERFFHFTLNQDRMSSCML